LDGTQIASLTSAPYSINWNTLTVANGSHTLTATARDAAGLTSQSSVAVSVSNVADTTVPTITIVSPANGSTLPRNNLSVTVNATDNVGVTRVQLYIDNKLVTTSTTAPFTTSWSCRKAATGAHTVQCLAYDAAGNVGASQTVTVYK
jgi:hypothetical protein